MIKMNKIGCVILAAGKGARFNSDKPKVLHELHGKPILQNVLDVSAAAGFNCPTVVIGPKSGQLRDFLKNKANIAVQKKQIGTADAIKSAGKELFCFEDILILYGDVPLVKPETLKSLIKEHKRSGASCTLLTVILDDPAEYGRIIRDNSGGVGGIIEHKEASEEQKKIREINTGLYCFKRRELFNAIEKVRRSPVKKEYYLTDLISILIGDGKKVSALRTNDPNEVIGINSREDLSKAYLILRDRAVKRLISGSVTILDASAVYISPDAKIGRDTVIYPFVTIERDVRIGKRCSIGPFCRLRSHTVLGDDVEIGNFVEVVRTKVKSGTKAKHLTYLGDCLVGRDVNVGCGAITANFDGKAKHQTVIEDKVFIGSGTILVAPVKVGKSALTGAGSVVLRNEDVPPKAVVVGVPAKVLSKSR
ncbi:MAG: NTP transferase domain-containing protein [Candidatus Omnitrophota bacterium]